MSRQIFNQVDLEILSKIEEANISKDFRNDIKILFTKVSEYIETYKQQNKIPNINIFEEANSIIFDRDEEKDRKYGPFSESMSKTARVATELCNKDISTEDVFKVLISLKISRMAYNHKHDTMLDAIGYITGLDTYLKNKLK